MKKKQSSRSDHHNNKQEKKLNTPFGIVAVSSSIPISTPPDELFEHLLGSSQQHSDRQRLHLKYAFDPAQWLRFFKRYSTPPHLHPSKISDLRIYVQTGTVHAVLRGKYFVVDAPQVTTASSSAADDGITTTVRLKAIHLDKRLMERACLGSKMYTSDHAFSASKAANATTEILVVEGDCLEVGLWLKEKRGLSVAVLNMASRSHPGGGYRSGAGAQEEPYAEAYSNPPVEEVNGEIVLSGSIINHTKRKISAMLNIALDNGHDGIVLSAFGCGAYGNPPGHMARLFREVVMGAAYRDRFKTIAFAIINDHNAFKPHNPKGMHHFLSSRPSANEAFKCSVIQLDDLLGTSVTSHSGSASSSREKNPSNRKTGQREWGNSGSSRHERKESTTND